MPSDVFRPRLPLDPFATLHQPPWRITDISNPGPHTILLLGAPSHQDLLPLASLATPNSLLVIATHTPPPLPASPALSTTILHLPAPLDIHDAGAVRLVALLDRAQRVVHAWRTSRPSARILQFAELYPGGEFTIPEVPELAQVAGAQQLQPHPEDDTASLASSSSDVSLASITTTSSSTRRLSSLFSPKQKSAMDSKPHFTALINFLPPGLPDKALLKHAILVTTLAAPFLAPPSLSSPYPSQSKRKRSSGIFASLTSLASLRKPRTRTRLSSLFASSSPSPPSAYPPSSYSYSPSHSTPPSVYSSRESLIPTPNNAHPHIVHVLPYSASSSASSFYSSPSSSSSPSSYARHLSPPKPSPRRHHAAPNNAKPKIAQSIEQFLLSFAYPPSALSTSSPSASAGAAASGSASGTHSPLRSSPLASSSTSPSTNRSPSTSTNTSRSRSTSRSSALPSFPNHPTLPGTHSAQAQAIPFLLPAGVLGTTPSTGRGKGKGRCVAELVLSGGMDGAASGLVGVGAGAGIGMEEGWPRAWIASAADIELIPPPIPSTTPLSTPNSSTRSRRAEETIGLGIELGLGVERDGSNGRKSKSKRSVRRNEAGLPTPPESSGSGSSSEDELEVPSPHDTPPSSYHTKTTPDATAYNLVEHAHGAPSELSHHYHHAPATSEQTLMSLSLHSEQPAPEKEKRGLGVKVRRHVSRLFSGASTDVGRAVKV
ncbi:hypothetical protein DXG03_007914 [Asterophora parasitica]|uniref:Uncharacterized protein n=1 Tax=Asterophora parasitica TaxID=117018 RepID=A0A9P7G7K7_9AGAR|nr:hypothetical protein DXG03_007914 [Asterophora parasitica]